jgi:hypothetical protein
MQGSIVYRDERLGLLYVRCTECGTNASVTEYPVSWKWLRRFGILIAGLMCLVALAFLIADVAATTVSTYEFTWEATQAYGDALQREGVRLDPNANWQMTDAFRADTETIARITSDPTVVATARRNALIALLPVGIISLAAGMAWSALLLHRRVIWAIAFQLVPLSLALAFTSLVMVFDRPIGNASWSYRQFAIVEYGTDFAIQFFTFIVTVRIAAILLGRPLIRLFIWTVVPTRVRVAISSQLDDPRRPVVRSLTPSE